MVHLITSLFHVVQKLIEIVLVQLDIYLMLISLCIFAHFGNNIIEQSSICIGICFCLLLLLCYHFLLSLEFMLFCLNECEIHKMLNIGFKHLIHLRYFSIPCIILDQNCRHHAAVQSAGIFDGILYDSSNN